MSICFDFTADLHRVKSEARIPARRCRNRYVKILPGAVWDDGAKRLYPEASEAMLAVLFSTRGEIKEMRRFCP